MIFPQGLSNRNFVIRDLAARTIFVMLYIEAIEGTGRWFRPDQATRMTDTQAKKTSPEDREVWFHNSLLPNKGAIPGRWYAQNTREPIRDETIRNGLLDFGAAIERKDLPTTSSKPRYALQQEFAALFNPNLQGRALNDAIVAWRDQNLSHTSLVRTRLVRAAISASDDQVVVAFPNGESRQMSPGQSSVISKAVIEVFAKIFLKIPGVLWLSESGNKVVQRDDNLARMIGLEIHSERILPDIILVDLGSKEPLLVFVEVVASDGPINEKRKAELYKLVNEAGLKEENTTFVTAYLDRGDSGFQKTFRSLALDTFAWCQSEPESLITLSKNFSGDTKFLFEILEIL